MNRRNSDKPHPWTYSRLELLCAGSIAAGAWLVAFGLLWLVCWFAALMASQP